ncbi:MAG: signal peptidase II [Nanoarchaeota archaeon]
MNKKYILFCSTFMGVFILDQISKMAIRSTMSLHDKIWLIKPLLSLTYTTNTGAAFSILQNQNILLIGISVLVLGGIAFYSRTSPLQLMLPLGLITGGILGNLMDRLLLGSVVDFIDLQVWPVFNAADSSLVIGAVIIAFASFKK